METGIKAGILTIQAPLEEGQTEPAGPVMELVETLAEILKEPKAQSGSEHRQH
jgi:hypothetical protein